MEANGGGRGGEAPGGCRGEARVAVVRLQSPRGGLSSAPVSPSGCFAYPARSRVGVGRVSKVHSTVCIQPGDWV